MGETDRRTDGSQHGKCSYEWEHNYDAAAATAAAAAAANCVIVLSIARTA